MKHRYAPKLIELMRCALRRVEQSESSKDKESALRHLRQNVVRNIAEHELHASEPAADSAEATPEDSAA